MFTRGTPRICPCNKPLIWKKWMITTITTTLPVVGLAIGPHSPHLSETSTINILSTTSRIRSTEMKFDNFPEDNCIQSPPTVESGELNCGATGGSHTCQRCQQHPQMYIPWNCGGKARHHSTVMYILDLSTELWGYTMSMRFFPRTSGEDSKLRVDRLHTCFLERSGSSHLPASPEVYVQDGHQHARGHRWMSDAVRDIRSLAASCLLSPLL